MANLCEACKKEPIELVESADDPTQPYKLCIPCHNRLLKRSLRPIEWYNLTVIHTPKKYLLHDDFYDDNGEAAQPEEDVSDSELITFRALTLDEVESNLESLIDFSITRWFLEEEVIHSLKVHDRNHVLHSVKDRFINTNNYEIKSRMLEITADVIGDLAADWVRELWDNYDEEYLLPLSWATAGSIPITEGGLSLVLDKLQMVNEKELPLFAFSCLYRFRSNEVLDWIESYSRITFHDSWGRLAAVCFPQWEQMRKWLDLGRPLSLIALDTMANCVLDGNDYHVERFNPKISGLNDCDIETVLNDYYQKDTVARVRMKLAFIKDHIEEIFQ